MISIDVNHNSKSQVDALKECIDLCSNGYYEMFALQEPDYWFIKLRHQTNGRILKFILDKKGWRIMEKDKVLKEVHAVV